MATPLSFFILSKIQSFILCFMFSHYLMAQPNFVPNPSFENPDSCARTLGLIKVANPWHDPVNSADLFNPCQLGFLMQVPNNIGGSQYPHSGLNYAGIQTYSNPAPAPDFWINFEYLQTKLKNKLIANHKYYLEFFVSMSDTICLACNSLGARVTLDSIHSTPSTQLTGNTVVANTQMLTDKINWQKISGIFKAQGGEEFLTIGNFTLQPISDTIRIVGCSQPLQWPFWSYYYIDDVSLYNVTINAGNDTVICNPNTINTLKVKGDFTSYLWSTSDTSKYINITQSGTYWVKGNIPNIGDFYDTITVTFAQAPTFALSNDTTIYQGTTATLIASGNYQNYSWNTGINATTITVTDSGIYTIEVYDYDHCKTQKSVAIKTIPKPELPFLLPTIIQQSKEKLIFKPKTGLSINIDKLTVFDTFGQIVFEGINYKNEFSAPHVANGLYYYKIQYGNEEIINKLMVVE